MDNKELIGKWCLPTEDEWHQIIESASMCGAYTRDPLDMPHDKNLRMWFVQEGDEVVVSPMSNQATWDYRHKVDVAEFFRPISIIEANESPTNTRIKYLEGRVEELMKRVGALESFQSKKILGWDHMGQPVYENNNP